MSGYDNETPAGVARLMALVETGGRRRLDAIRNGLEAALGYPDKWWARLIEELGGGSFTSFYATVDEAMIQFGVFSPQSKARFLFACDPDRFPSYPHPL